MTPLTDARDAHRHGGKAVGLGEALRAGLPVPHGIALDVDLVQALATAPRRAAARAPELRAPALAALLRQSPVAVRSSAIGEDSETASFAGQHVSRLNIASPDALLDAIRAVYASAHSPAARAYRERLGVPGRPRIAVVVQTMIAPECAGVLFTRNPLTGADERVVEAAWGLGEAVVAGLVTPDRWHMLRGGKVVAFLPGHKDVEVRATPDGGTHERPVDPHRAARPCLTPALLAQLEHLADACERHFGHPGDLEWAVQDGRTHLLQCRPVTR